MKNLLPVLLGIAFIVSGIAFLQAEKANRQLAEQLRQTEEIAKAAEAEVAALRDATQKPASPASQAPQGLPGTPPPPAVTESAEPPSPEPGEATAQQQSPEMLDKEVNEHAGLIRARVERAWRIPPEVPANLGCIVKIELMPSGEVQNVSIIQSSGNATLDRSAIAAVRRASPFPMPASPEAAARFRSFNFRFKPRG